MGQKSVKIAVLGIWNSGKDKKNICKHGISFELAQYSFQDQKRIIAYDRKHSTKKEKRYFCYGEVNERIYFHTVHGTCVPDT